MSGGCDNDNRPWCSSCRTYHRDDCSRVDGYTAHNCAETECPRRVKLRIDTSRIVREP